MTIKLIIQMLVFFVSVNCVAEPSLMAAPLGGSTGTSGIWCERKSGFAITQEHELRLTLSLRRITGYDILRFGSDGSLILDDSLSTKGGSAEARRILMRALCSNASFVIEDYSASGQVIFGQAVSERVIYGAREGEISQVWRLRLDFDDFQQMGASSEVRASFDEGITFFHELLHGLGYNDASRDGELGACEEIVNRVRGELGLPLRDQYFANAWRISERLTSVRLRFRRPARDGNSARWESSYLFFILTEPADYFASMGGAMRVGPSIRR